ncbi:MAG: hypothetical protein ACYDGM_12135, partial [Vulcanimicrobiaceae bacterium]
MLFARAVVRGARRFCAALFDGAVYLPDELEDVRDAEATVVVGEPMSLDERVARAATKVTVQDVQDVPEPVAEPVVQAVEPVAQAVEAVAQPVQAVQVAMTLDERVAQAAKAVEPEEEAEVAQPEQPAKGRTKTPQERKLRTYMAAHDLTVADVVPLIKQHIGEDVHLLGDLTPEQVDMLILMLDLPE